jgi:hypothetical protein
VRGHYRGTGESQAIYRSRSALNLLYEIAPLSMNNADIEGSDWFAFEQATALLLEKYLNFTILDRAVRGRADHGVDILATKRTGDKLELWVVQCKHYRVDNPVRPRVIRELLGAMVMLPHDPDQVVRGMLITSGRFTGDALKLAAAEGIQTYAGDQLAAIYAAVNQEEQSS